MALLNYTTGIEAEKTIGEIQGILARAGALAIGTQFSAGVVSDVSFQIGTPFGPTVYSLPCNVDAVLELLRRQAAAGKVPKRLVSAAQARRVGWRIVKDWIEAQCALVQTRMVTLDQVFLPYARTRTGETVYEKYLSAGMVGLAIEGPKEAAGAR